MSLYSWPSQSGGRLFVIISPGRPHEIVHARVSTQHAHALTSCNKHAWLVTWGCFAHEQVKVAVHHPIIALQEKVFRPLIEPAYYSAKEFHFDLTAPEALSLLEAFTHRQVRPHNTSLLSRSCVVPVHHARCNVQYLACITPTKTMNASRMMGLVAWEHTATGVITSLSRARPVDQDALQRAGGTT